MEKLQWKRMCSMYRAFDDQHDAHLVGDVDLKVRRAQIATRAMQSEVAGHAAEVKVNLVPKLIQPYINTGGEDAMLIADRAAT